MALFFLFPSGLIFFAIVFFFCLVLFLYFFYYSQFLLMFWIIVNSWAAYTFNKLFFYQYSYYLHNRQSSTCYHSFNDGSELRQHCFVFLKLVVPSCCYVDKIRGMMLAFLKKNSLSKIFSIQKLYTIGEVYMNYKSPLNQM